MTIIKNLLFYYYHLYPDKIIRNIVNYYFTDNNYHYYLFLVNRQDEEVISLISLSNSLYQLNEYRELVKNINNSYISLINDKRYLLIKYLAPNRNININDLKKTFYTPNKYPLLNRDNHSYLWSMKIDYFEYQKAYIEKKYPLLYSSIDYYIGFAEVAISYLNEVERTIKKESTDLLTITHKRLSVKDTLYDYYNDLNFIIDYKVRDYAEYLKSLFISGYSLRDIAVFLNSLELTSYSVHLLFARVLFPSFYFDIYEDIVNNIEKEDEIITIIDKAIDYEDFIQTTYDILKQKGLIIKVDFLEK